MKLKPKSVLVTGCSRGIGLEFIKQLLKLPQPPKHLFATCRNPKDAQELNQLAAENSSLHIMRLDVTDYIQLPSLVAEVESKVEGEGLSLLINNAGIVSREPIGEVTPETMREVYETNTIAPVMITQAFLPLLKQAASTSSETELTFSRAGVVLLSSKVGSCADNASGGRYPYRASKAALNVCAVSMMNDLKKFGIVTSVIHPGWVKTEMGGANALISTEQSVQGMLNVISQLNDTNMYKFYDYKNEVIPW